MNDIHSKEFHGGMWTLNWVWHVVSRFQLDQASKTGTSILSIFKQGNTITHNLRSARSDGHDSAAARILPRFRRRKIREKERDREKLKEERTRPVTKKEIFGIHGNVSYSVSLSFLRNFALWLLSKTVLETSSSRYFQLPFVFETFLSFFLFPSLSIDM